MKFFLILALSIVVAGLAGFSAIDGVAKNKNPAIPIALGSKNGFVLASQTQVILQQHIIANNGVLPKNLSKSSTELAKVAFMNEPTAFRAVRFLALGMAGQGQLDKARNLMQNTVKLTKRDRVTNMWFVSDFGQQGDLESVLHYYDLTLRSSAESASLLFPLMAKALEDDNAIDPFEDVLANQPPWASDFWHMLASTPDSLENSSVLRLKLKKAGIANPANNDATIVKRLVANDRLSAAETFFRSLSNAKKVSPAALLQNENFSEPSSYPPLDWELFSTGEYGAVIDQSTGTLLVSAVEDARGTVARQLFSMDSGVYSLTVQSADQPNISRQPTAKVTIRCAEKTSGGGSVLETQLTSQNLTQDFVIAPNGCKFFWLDLNVLNDDQSQGLDLAVKKIAVKRKI